MVALKTLQEGQAEEIEELQEDNAKQGGKLNKAVLSSMTGERGNVLQSDKDTTELRRNNKFRASTAQANLDR